MTLTSDEEEHGPWEFLRTKDRVANEAELQWPTNIRIHYKEGIKIRIQKPVIKTIIAETIHRAEVHMLTEDAFPEAGRREEFRYTNAKQAIKALSTNLDASEDYKDAYSRAKKDSNFVHKLGELVSL